MEPIIGPLLTLLGVVTASYLTYRVSTRKLRSDGGQSMIDQHQEDNTTLRKEKADLQRQVRIQGDYIGELRKHIVDGNPPPPPPYPQGLIT